MEMALTLATIAQKYRFRLVEGHPVVPLASITLRPRYGIRVVLESRSVKSSEVTHVSVPCSATRDL
jgi:cytochrome P450